MAINAIRTSCSRFKMVKLCEVCHGETDVR